MKHWHCWSVIAATAACCVGSVWVLSALQRDDPPGCNPLLIAPIGFAFLVFVELIAYAAWCVVLGGLWIARRARRDG